MIHYSCFHSYSNDGETGYMYITAKLSHFTLFLCFSPYEVGFGESLLGKSDLLCLLMWAGRDLMITWGKFFLAKTMTQTKYIFTCNLRWGNAMKSRIFTQSDVWFRFPVPNAMRNHIYLTNYSIVLILWKIHLFFPLLLMSLSGIIPLQPLEMIFFSCHLVQFWSSHNFFLGYGFGNGKSEWWSIRPFSTCSKYDKGFPSRWRKCSRDLVFSTS